MHRCLLTGLLTLLLLPGCPPADDDDTGVDDDDTGVDDDDTGVDDDDTGGDDDDLFGDDDDGPPSFNGFWYGDLRATDSKTRGEVCLAKASMVIDGAAGTFYGDAACDPAPSVGFSGTVDSGVGLFAVTATTTGWSDSSSEATFTAQGEGTFGGEWVEFAWSAEVIGADGAPLLLTITADMFHDYGE